MTKPTNAELVEELRLAHVKINSQKELIKAKDISMKNTQAKLDEVPKTKPPGPLYTIIMNQYIKACDDLCDALIDGQDHAALKNKCIMLYGSKEAVRNLLEK